MCAQSALAAEPSPAASDKPEAVLAPLREYQRLAIDPKADLSGYALVFAPQGGYLNDYPAFYWAFPAAPGRPDLPTDTALDAKVRELGLSAKPSVLPPDVLSITGDRAYAVVPETGAASMHGKMIPLSDRYVLGLVRTAAGWRIAAYANEDPPTELGYASASAAEAAPVMAAVTAYLKNPSPAGGAAHPSDGMIIDNFAPYFWQGPSAFSDWWTDLRKRDAANQISDVHVSIGPPIKVIVSGARAFAEVPIHMTLSAKGAPQQEDGVFTMALEKGAGGWMVDAWAYAKRHGS
jgi:ketosteroid isomerase-like protein